MKISKHFKSEEFKCKCGRDHNFHLYNGLLDILENVREYFNEPVIIMSGYRCEAHNKKVGGAPNSKHVLGQAADIKVVNTPPENVANYLESQYPNSCGIGRYNTFTHIDVRTNKARW